MEGGADRPEAGPHRPHRLGQRRRLAQAGGGVPDLAAQFLDLAHAGADRGVERAPSNPSQRGPVQARQFLAQFKADTTGPAHHQAHGPRSGQRRGGRRRQRHHHALVPAALAQGGQAGQSRGTRRRRVRRGQAVVGHVDHLQLQGRPFSSCRTRQAAQRRLHRTQRFGSVDRGPARRQQRHLRARLMLPAQAGEQLARVLQRLRRRVLAHSARVEHQLGAGGKARRRRRTIGGQRDVGAGALRRRSGRAHFAPGRLIAATAAVRDASEPKADDFEHHVAVAVAGGQIVAIGVDAVGHHRHHALERTIEAHLVDPPRHPQAGARFERGGHLQHGVERLDPGPRQVGAQPCHGRYGAVHHAPDKAVAGTVVDAGLLERVVQRGMLDRLRAVGHEGLDRHARDRPRGLLRHAQGARKTRLAGQREFNPVAPAGIDRAANVERDVPADPGRPQELNVGQLDRPELLRTGAIEQDRRARQPALAADLVLAHPVGVRFEEFPHRILQQGVDRFGRGAGATAFGRRNPEPRVAQRIAAQHDLASAPRPVE